MEPQKRNRRHGVEDRWTKADGQPSTRNGVGMRWRARYVDDSGREHNKMFGTKKAAQEWLNQQVSDQVTGAWTDPNLSVVTFGVMAERWFKTKATRAPKTVAGYRSLLDTVVLPRWKDVALGKIAFEDMQEWVTGLSVDGSTKTPGKGLSPSRVIQAHQVVGQVLRYAIKAKHLANNPAEDLELPAKVEGEQRYLTHELLHRLAVASGRFRTLVLVLGYCGLRFGEASALRISDVDIENRRIEVKRSATYVTGQGMTEGTTKTKKARTVPVPAFLAALLKTEIGDRAGVELVFPARRNEYLGTGELRWVFDPAAKAVGVPGLKPHELRHTCASLAISAGANIKVVQRLLGHKTAALTLDRYGHLYGDDLDAVAEAFDAAAVPLRSVAQLKVVGPESHTV
jgi:integrase